MIKQKKKNLCINMKYYSSNWLKTKNRRESENENEEIIDEKHNCYFFIQYIEDYVNS